MGHQKRQTTIIFLARDHLEFFSESFGQSISLVFPPSVVSDIEIINRDEFAKQLSALVTANKIPPSNTIIVLSETTLFEREFSSQDPNTQKQETDEFIETVPFEDVGYRVVKLPKGGKVIATNADLYESIKTILEKNGFTVTIAIPETLIGRTITHLDQETVQFILKNSDVANRYNFLVNEFAVLRKIEEEKHTWFGRYKQQIVIVFFVLSIGFFIFALVTFFQAQRKHSQLTPTPQIVSPTINTPTSTPVPTIPLPPESSSSSTLNTRLPNTPVNP